ncbi:hypothetical protein [Microbacterium sp. H6]|uniref:hypothetical protein n=1 Tax=Microbacterium sp. H6 TaxID=421122 RepID=UPI000DE54878|nr:hypothetical protein [Microbacterium sp. H6]RBO72765.1 hypothetical protein DSP71_09000 [Microbacterium sp. H6]
MNKQTIFLIISILAGLGLIGVVLLLIVKPDATATLMNFLFTLLTLLAGFGGLATMQAQQNKEIATIKANTNGTLSRKEEEIAVLRGALAEHAPEALRDVETGAVPTVVTRAQLRAEREQLTDTGQQ